MTCSARTSTPDQSMAETLRNGFRGIVSLFAIDRRQIVCGLRCGQLAIQGVCKRRLTWMWHSKCMSDAIKRRRRLTWTEMGSSIDCKCVPSSRFPLLLRVLCRMRGFCQSAVRTVVGVLKSSDGSHLIY